MNGSLIDLNFVGSEDDKFVSAINAPCLKVLHVDSDQVDKSSLAVEAEAFTHKAVAILLDTKTKASTGGTGISFDWNVVKSLEFPVIFIF